jgi:phosphopantothenoylcysteine decarboxylase/phosphopantothenate--cysteine ligase
MLLKDKRITLGVTGAISAYKAAELTRLFVKAGSLVRPVMTRGATEFITPLSLATLASNPVAVNVFDEAGPGGISHIELAQSSDLIVVAPATANFIGKVASGIADDLLTTLVMAASAPVLIAPSMNTRMWDNPVVAANVERLLSLGYGFIGPDEGELACGYSGRGRLAPVADILDAADELLRPSDMAGEKVLVTAGPTREAIDPVRFVSNSSSGRMGYAIARAAKKRGAEVVLISGPSRLSPPRGVTFVPVETADEMYEASVVHFPQSTTVIMAAAVSDYRPARSFPEKVKKTAGPISVEMERTRDILKELGRRKREQFLVGFALETENLEENARKKLREKNLDMVVANTAGALNSPVGQVTIIDGDGSEHVLPELDKDVIAESVLDRVLRLKS